MGFPTPQFGVPLSPNQINPELPFYPVYGVTPSNRYIPLSITDNGYLNVNATFSGSITIGEIGVADESGFTFGTSLEQPIGGVYQDTNPTLSPGQTGAVRLTEYRAFHTNLRDSSGNELGILSNPLRIDPTGTTTQPISVVTLPLPTNAAKETGGNLASINAGIETLNSLVPSVYDYIALSYMSGNLTQVQYFEGGSGGTLISTLTLMYDVSSNLVSVAQS